MNLQEHLTKLGKTTQEIADTLKAKGIKGMMYSMCQCPIANYLRAEGCTYACVSGSIAARWKDELQCLDTPLIIASFITAFDHGEYPELIS